MVPRIWKGLSPPTRGNLYCGGGVGGVRSIPAHAGEPALDPLADRWVAVYPRPRGGTRDYHLLYLGGYGSIPAHAGEP